jgi:integrase
MTPRGAYPYLYKDTDRHGRVRWRLRVPGRKTVTIKGDYGSPEFAAHYHAAMEDGDISPVKRGVPAKPGTVAALARLYLNSADFAALSPATQRARRYLMERFANKYGRGKIAELEPIWVRKIMQSYAKTPGTARNVLSVLRILVKLAIEEGLRRDDPTVGIKRPKLSKHGWHDWTEAEIAQFETKHPIGSRARLAFAFALYTAQRSADLIRMGKQHVREGRISVAQQKTGTRLWITLHPDLKSVIEATATGNLTYLVSEKGKPYATANSFGHRMRKWAKEPVLPDARCMGSANHVLGAWPRPDARLLKSWR